MRRELFALLLLTACHKPVEQEPAAAPRKVSCAPLVTKGTQDAVEVRGTVAPLPDRDALVAAQVSGRLLKVEVREGDEVTAGQVVARVDDAPLEDAARQADAQLSRAAAEAANAETTLGRVQHVFERGIAPRQEVDDSATKLASAKAAAIEAEAAARQAHRQIERSVVKSPLAGVVLKVLRRAGELVDGTPATAVVEIGDVSKLELAADVPAQDLVRLARGAEATVTFPGLPGASWQAVVSMVSPSVERTTGLGTVRITLLPGASKLPPVGLFGTARIAQGEARSAIFVPTAALRNVIGGEGEVVVCGGDHVFHVKKVHAGRASAGLTEVSGELPAEGKVAVAPVLGLAEGDAFE